MVYPVVDTSCGTHSYGQFADGFGLTKAAMQWFWQQFLGPEADGNSSPASLLAADDFAGLPPAHVITAECDVLRDEGEKYAARLIAAGVPTTVRRYEGMIHGFVHLSSIFETGRQPVLDAASVLRKAFGDRS
ncbi:MAG: alpha/beta hydrolase fold domain-containing protein [Pirellulales bacterium]